MPKTVKQQIEELREKLRRARKLIGPKQGPLNFPDPQEEAVMLVEEAREGVLATLRAPEFTGVLGVSGLYSVPFGLPSLAAQACVIADNALYHYTATKPPQIEQVANDLVTLKDLIDMQPGGLLHVICHGQTGPGG
ncbi:MAG: hypothetical protein AAF432_04500 [Planctomycetota bacterium]